jgi:membrane associated rhomboid family serine protease
LFVPADLAFIAARRAGANIDTAPRTDMLVKPTRERLFNLPPVIIALVAILGLVHAILVLVLTPEDVTEVLLLFAFIPARYSPSLLLGEVLPGGWAADVWTFVTYALIHADLGHLGFNGLWLLAFGTPVARRFGTVRFIVFFAATSAAGAAAHLATHFGELLPMVGASAAISGAMAAAMRFAFQPGGPLGSFGAHDENSYRVPAVPISQMLRDPRVLVFLLVWFGLNILFGFRSFPVTSPEQNLAWEAHIGGFVTGLLGFALFDPVPNPHDGRDHQDPTLSGTEEDH